MCMLNWRSATVYAIMEICNCVCCNGGNPERAFLIPYLQCRWGEEERKIVHMDI